MLSGLCGGFSGRASGAGGPRGPGAGSEGRILQRFGARCGFPAARKTRARNQAFQCLAASFPGDRRRGQSLLRCAEAKAGCWSCGGSVRAAACRRRGNPGREIKHFNALRQVFRAIVTAQVGAAFRSNLVLRSDAAGVASRRTLQCPLERPCETPASRAPQDEDRGTSHTSLGSFRAIVGAGSPCSASRGAKAGCWSCGGSARAAVSRRRGKPGREIKHFNALRQVFRAIVTPERESLRSPGLRRRRGHLPPRSVRAIVKRGAERRPRLNGRLGDTASLERAAERRQLRGGGRGHARSHDPMAGLEVSEPPWRRC